MEDMIYAKMHNIPISVQAMVEQIGGSETINTLYKGINWYLKEHPDDGLSKTYLQLYPKQIQKFSGLSGQDLMKAICDAKNANPRAAYVGIAALLGFKAQTMRGRATR